MRDNFTRALDLQTTFDMAVQEYGTIEGIFFLLKDNPSLPNVCCKLPVLQSLKIDKNPNIEIDNEARMYQKVYLNNLTKVATSDNENQGVNYWFVESDFIVQ